MIIRILEAMIGVILVAAFVVFAFQVVVLGVRSLFNKTTTVNKQETTENNKGEQNK